MNIREHLIERHINLELHRPVLCNKLNIASFYCWSLSGKLVGYQQYNPGGNKRIFNSKLGGKYYTYRKQPTVCVWGTESLSQSDGVVYLTEGIFDAARMTNLGQSAIAVLANNPPKDYKNWLKLLNRPVVVVCDNDSAGMKLAKFGDHVEVVPQGKDLGDAPDDYVRHLLDKYGSTC